VHLDRGRERGDEGGLIGLELAFRHGQPVPGEWLRVAGCRLRVAGCGFGVWGLGFGFGVWCLGFGVWGLGFGVWGLGCTARRRRSSFGRLTPIPLWSTAHAPPPRSWVRV